MRFCMWFVPVASGASCLMTTHLGKRSIRFSTDGVRTACGNACTMPCTLGFAAKPGRSPRQGPHCLSLLTVKPKAFAVFFKSPNSLLPNEYQSPRNQLIPESGRTGRPPVRWDRCRHAGTPPGIAFPLTLATVWGLLECGTGPVTRRPSHTQPTVGKPGWCLFR